MLGAPPAYQGHRRTSSCVGRCWQLCRTVLAVVSDGVGSCVGRCWQLCLASVVHCVGVAVTNRTRMSVVQRWRTTGPSLLRHTNNALSPPECQRRRVCRTSIGDELRILLGCGDCGAVKRSKARNGAEKLMRDSRNFI